MPEWVHPLLAAVVREWRLLSPAEGESQLYWPCLLTTSLLAAFAWRRSARRGGRLSPAALLRWAFPRRIWAHPSARLDYQLVVAATLVGPLLALGTSVAVAALGQAAGEGVRLALGPPAPALPWTPASLIVASLGLAVVQDFTTFLAHRLHHRVPLLWEIHRVHHSAEVLTPFTLFRKHPLEEPLYALIGAPFVFAFTAVLGYVRAGSFLVVSVFGVNLAYALFRLAGANLRHSHVWVAWPAWLSRLLISPAQHQIHHSVDERHRERNYGEMLALWDWALGSLYVPRQREALRFGLPGAPGPAYASLGEAYLLPLRSIARRLRSSSR